MTTQSVVVLCMKYSGHPEDLIKGKTLVYTGQEKLKKHDSVIPTATILLHRVKNTDGYLAHRVEFHRQLRVRNEPDPRNPGVQTFRPLFEFRILEQIPERQLPALYESCLESKVLNLLKYGLLCDHDSIDRGVLPCKVFTDVPSLYGPRMLKWWKKSKLIEIIVHSVQ